MKKRVKKAHAKKASRTKNSKRYTCDSCGIIVSTVNECACDPCDIVCCGQDMRLV